MDQALRDKIRLIVTEYVRIFPQEFASFRAGMPMKRAAQRTKYGELAGTSYIERKTLEMPETLYTALHKALTTDEFTEFKTKRGMRWFAKSHPEFAVSTI